MSGFGPSPVYAGAMALDPTKHVNYVEGMVLGAADLRQEFAYLAHRDRWTVRELLGHGTIWGLQVTSRTGARGPEIVVAPGVASDARGQLIRVAPAQCAPLNDWLAGRTTEVDRRRLPTAAPNVFSLPLFVVLRYRRRETDAVPIAGEPCRTEQDALAPSRIADDFQLELAFDPPPQPEDDALREFVQWLRAHLTVTAGGAASLDLPRFLDAIRAAAAAADTVVSSPVGAGPRLVDSSPVTMVAVPAALLPDYLRAALRLWVTELRARPGWRPDYFASPDEGDRVLLAQVTVPIEPSDLDRPTWAVAPGPAAITVTDEARPFLLHARFLQEWLIAHGAGLGAGTAAAPTGPRVVAAGVVPARKVPGSRPVLGGLQVVQAIDVGATRMVQLTFSGYIRPPDAGGGPQYVVKVLPWAPSPAPNITATFLGFDTSSFQLLVSWPATPPTPPTDRDQLQLMVEVSQYA